jgi:hypothetical protein
MSTPNFFDNIEITGADMEKMIRNNQISTLILMGVTSEGIAKFVRPLPTDDIADFIKAFIKLGANSDGI